MKKKTENNVIRIGSTATPNQILNVNLTDKQKKFYIGNEKCTVATYKQLPHKSLINVDGNINGTPYGIVNRHVRSECGNVHPESHIHVVWFQDREIYCRDTIWVHDLTQNKTYPQMRANRTNPIRQEYEKAVRDDHDFYKWIYHYNLTGKRKYKDLPVQEQQSIDEQYRNREQPGSFEEWLRKNHPEKNLREIQLEEAKTPEFARYRWRDSVQALYDYLPQLIIGA